VDETNPLRIAWLFPSLMGGNYWHPIFCEFTQCFQHTTIYTGGWPGFSPGFEDTFRVDVVGDTKVVTTNEQTTGYERTYILPSWGIIPRLLKFRPQVIFTSAFSLWTLLVLLLKIVLRWKVIIVFDGVSPGRDYLNTGIRVVFRRPMVSLADALITNSKAGENYLTQVLHADPANVFTQPYQVPDISALLKASSAPNAPELNIQLASSTVFLFIGQLIPRKGVDRLLQACVALQSNGCSNYRVIIIGSGSQEIELKQYVNEHHLQEHIQFLGQVSYAQLGTYFQCADVFVFPTLEDIWGMVVLEAMAFGKPILCSKWAGAIEMMTDGKNGYIFDPHDPQELAHYMTQLMSHSDLIKTMGETSRHTMAMYTHQQASQFLIDVVNRTTNSTSLY
jgi:glycosyltransferase involved in cell wall biosynthesis